jgi:hypothetical protein
MVKAHRSALGLLALGMFAAAEASADEREWRFSLAGSGTILSLEEAGGSGSPWAAGGRFRVGYGLSDLFELGGAGGYVTTGRRIAMPGANIAGQSGTYGAEVSAIETSVDLRLIVGNRISTMFARLHPLVGLRTGALIRMLDASLLVDGDQNVILRPKDDTSVLPFMAGSLGLEYRFGPTWVIGVMGDYLYAGSSYQGVGFLAEIGFVRY